MSNQVTKQPGGSSIEALYAHPLPNAPGLKMVGIKVSYEPGGSTPRHRHGNAFVTATLLEGSVESGINDEEPKVFRAGESWTEAPGDIHSVSRNASQTEPATFMVVFIAPVDQEEFVIFDCPACEVARDAK